MRTDCPTTKLKQPLYVRKVPQSGLEVACSRETAGDGVASNFLRLEDPPLGITTSSLMEPGDVVRLCGRDRGGTPAQCLNQEDDDEDGYTDYPVDPGAHAPTTEMRPTRQCHRVL